MAGEKSAVKEVEQEVPANAAGREVLEYVNQQEKEADEAFAAAQGIDPEKEAEAGKETDEEADEETGIGKSQAPDDKEVKDKEVKDKEPETKDKVAEGDKAADDLTTGLNTENAQKRIAAAQKQMHSSNQRAVSAEGERDRLQEENEALQAQIKTGALTPEKKAGQVEAKKDEAVKVDDDELTKSLSELEQEYPEIAKPMLKMMAKQDAENKALTVKLDTLEQSEVTRVAEAKTVKTNTHVAAIAAAHSDYEEISNEPLLDQWIEELDPIQRAGARSIRKGGSTEDVIALLTKFKLVNGYEVTADSQKDTSKNKGNSKLDKAKKAANPSFNKSKDVNINDGQVLFTREQIDAMSPQEFAENEPAIDAAMAKGLVR